MTPLEGVWLPSVLEMQATLYERFFKAERQVERLTQPLSSRAQKPKLEAVL